MTPAMWLDGWHQWTQDGKRLCVILPKHEIHVSNQRSRDLITSVANENDDMACTTEHRLYYTEYIFFSFDFSLV